MRDDHYTSMYAHWGVWVAVLGRWVARPELLARTVQVNRLRAFRWEAFLSGSRPRL